MSQQIAESDKMSFIDYFLLATPIWQLICEIIATRIEIYLSLESIKRLAAYSEHRLIE